MEAETTIMLDLVTTVVRNIGANESGKLKVFADFKTTSDMLTLDSIKASQFALDGGGIISKIMQLENECKIEFEYVHVKTSNDNDEIGCSYEKQLVLECDSIANEVRINALIVR